MPRVRGHGSRSGIRLRRVLRPGFVALALTASAGCLSFVNPVDPPPPPLAQAAHEVPQAARDHVYIFFINGLDPAYLGNLTGLRDYVQALGFHKTYFGESFHFPWFAKDIREICAEDPDARVAIIGFSLGTNIGRGLARSLQDEGLHIDLLVCLSSNNLIDFSHERPENVSRYIDVLVHGRDLGHSDDPATERHNLKGFVWHFGGPSHPETLATIAHELTVLAASVPFVEPPLPPAPFQPEGLPPPRTMPRAEGGNAESGWDLLTPVSRLPDVPSLATGVAPLDHKETTSPRSATRRSPRGGPNGRQPNSQPAAPAAGGNGNVGA
jgi:hypothetical protein